VRRFNTYLRGWLGLLQSQVEGRPPTEFESALRGTLDAYPFLYAERVTWFSLPTTGSANEGFFSATGLSVPQDEIWLVEHMGLRLANGTGVNGVLAAAEEAGIACGVLAFNAITEHLVGEPSQVFLNGSMPVALASRPFVAIPGDNFGVRQWRSVTAGNFVYTVDLRAVRCKV